MKVRETRCIHLHSRGPEISAEGYKQLTAQTEQPSGASARLCVQQSCDHSKRVCSVIEDWTKCWKKKYCYILLSTFNWNLKEVLLLHTSETPRMSSKPLCEAAALSAFLFSFPSICRSFLISQLERGRVGGALLGFFSHCILMSALCSGFRQRSDVDFFLEKPLLPKLKKNLQDCKRKTPAPVELTHLLLWNFVGGKGRKSLPACDSPACPLSSCLFSWVCWFLSEPTQGKECR